ncbi:TrmH family RNA methyltransferase [Parabacteroides sp. PF5-9]|nr:TrmH family RNA methyltransferase [Parabacteroides sp. PF5-9]
MSKNQIKYIRSLGQKKYRDEYQTFVAEGNKLVADILPYFECDLMIAKPSWMATQGDIRAKELLVGDEETIHKISFLKTPQDVVAVFRQPQWKIEQVNPADQLVLALDNIQDPGNLGTIIRLADWFGISHIVCSTDTADVFNPKVIQATMGALARVQVHYTHLESYLQQMKGNNIPVYGTFLDGENIYTKDLSPNGVLIMGNEGNGIRPEIERIVNEKLYIPNYPAACPTSESLNVGTATAIVCAEFRRRLG